MSNEPFDSSLKDRYENSSSATSARLSNHEAGKEIDGSSFARELES